MTHSQWQVLMVYLAFTLVATILALLQKWLRPKAGGESVWRKYPIYIFINLIFILTSWLPHAWHVLNILLGILGALAAREIARALVAKPGALPMVTMTLVIAAGWLSQTQWLMFWLSTLLIGIALNTILGATNTFGNRILAFVGGMIYLPFCLATYLWVSNKDTAGFQVVFLYLAVATNDAMAQITGQLFGKQQLAPHISPAKTLEGALGGIAFAGAMGFVLSPLLGWTYPFGGSLGLVIGMAGLIGDLTASAWKRALGLKNFSALLGTQGGILDRFDGLIFAAPVFYLLTTWLT